MKKLSYNPIEHDVEHLKIFALVYHSFQVLKELLLQAMRVMEISYIEEKDSTIKVISYNYQVELHSLEYRDLIHPHFVDEFVLQYNDDEFDERLKVLLEASK